MKRKPSQARGDDTYQSILVAAASVLEQCGFEGFNTNRIAKAACISIGAVYQYFSRKEEIFTVLMQRQEELLLQRIDHEYRLRPDSGYLHAMVAAVGQFCATAPIQFQLYILYDSKVASHPSRLRCYIDHALFDAQKCAGLPLKRLSKDESSDAFLMILISIHSASGFYLAFCETAFNRIRRMLSSYLISLQNSMPDDESLARGAEGNISLQRRIESLQLLVVELLSKNERLRSEVAARMSLASEPG